MVLTRAMYQKQLHDNMIRPPQLVAAKPHDKAQLQTSRGNKISNVAPYEACLPYKKRKLWSRIPDPVERDEVPFQPKSLKGVEAPFVEHNTPNKEQDSEIKLAAVIVNLNNRIFEIKKDFGILYNMYLAERTTRIDYENILHKNNLLQK